MQVQELIQRCMQKRRSYIKNDQNRLQTFPAVPAGRGVPTLAPGVYQPLTDQLRVRFEQFGRWHTATHGHWLGLQDMEALWQESIDEELLSRIRGMRMAGERGWPNEASALFRPDRLSLFAGSDLNNEKIYLLWLEFEDEPELWVYDSNGESRYKDLSQYLEAYLNDDVTASERRWIIAEIERFGK